MKDKINNVEKFTDEKKNIPYVCLHKPEVLGDVEITDYKGHIKIHVKRGKFYIFIHPEHKTFQVIRRSTLEGGKSNMNVGGE